MPEHVAIRDLLAAARVGDDDAWRSIISAYEGRLRAYFRPRVVDQAVADDLVQETFVALWTSLPNFNLDRPLEPFLFTIAAHKLTDWLRREGRRPALRVDFHASSSSGGSTMPGGPVAPGRAVSSMAKSRERRLAEEDQLAEAVGELVEAWRLAGAWERLACVELVVLAGWQNKAAAKRLGVDEQTVANHKSYALRCVRTAVASRRIQGRISDLPTDGLPESSSS